MQRSVSEVIRSIQAMEGAGVPIRRVFPTAALEDVDPFLLLDHLGPIEFRPGQATGFPDHPHRGFETVTYVLEGAMEHRDSQGNHGIIGPGDVQWMTAGSGLVHSEMPGAEVTKNGGRLQGFQLWVNLPRKDKMVAPRYQGCGCREPARLPANGSQGCASKSHSWRISGLAMCSRGNADADSLSTRYSSTGRQSGAAGAGRL